MEISAILLAAGQSKRFGGDKLVAALKGRPLFSYTLDAVAAVGFAEKILVTNNPAIEGAAVQLGFKAVENPKAPMGQSTSVIAGVKAAHPANAYMFFVCDQPFLTAKTIKGMSELHSSRPEEIITPAAGGKRGSPVIFPNSYRNALLNLTGDTGGREIIRQSNNVLYFTNLDELELADADTAAELLRLGSIRKLHSGAIL